MPRKIFNVTVEFDLHAVTCPGVWLCPKGKVSLRIAMLDRSAETRDLEPAFPLLVHEMFTFSHSFRRVRYLQDLAQMLRGQLLSIQLIQWGPSLDAGNILSTFETSLEELLYPAPRCRALLAGVDVDLLMEPTDIFPGIIAPKLEVSTRTTIEEALTSSLCGDQSSVFAKTLISKTAGAQNKRQRKVCHSRGSKFRGSTRNVSGSLWKVPGSPRKFSGRLRAQSCLVRRGVGSLREPAASTWHSDGNESSPSLTPIQRLVWEATCRDLRGPLPQTDLDQSPHRCGCANEQREELPNAVTGLGRLNQRDRSNLHNEETPKARTGFRQTIQQRCAKCDRDEQTNAAQASPRYIRRNESTTYRAKGALSSEARLSETFGNGAHRSGSSMANETLREEATLSASVFDRAATLNGSLSGSAKARVTDSPTTSATRNSVSRASTLYASAGLRPSPAALRTELIGSFSPPSGKHALRRTSCAACAREQSSQRGEPNRTDRRRRKDGRCCGGDACVCAAKSNACACKGDACACAGKSDACACASKGDASARRPVPSLHRHGGSSSMERPALFSRRGTASTSYRESFYRNLEKFYKRLYDQALERRNGSCGC